MLCKGEEAFREMMSVLEKLDPLESLEYRSDLNLAVPEDPKDWSKKNIMNEILNKKKSELGDKYTDYSFHFDIGTSIPDVSAMLQLVDDNAGFNGIRRKNILSKKFKYIGGGFSKEKDKNKYCFYFCFAA
jgi:hypothetical protein